MIDGFAVAVAYRERIALPPGIAAGDRYTAEGVKGIDLR